MEMNCCSVIVDFGIKVVILAVHPDSFRVEVDSVVEFFPSKFIITFSFVHFGYS